MQPRTYPQDIDNNKNTENHASSDEFGQQGSIHINSDISNSSHHTLSVDDLNNGYIVVQAELPAPSHAQANWFSGIDISNLGYAAGVQNVGSKSTPYLIMPIASLGCGYVTKLSYFANPSKSLSKQDRLNSTIQDEESRITMLRDEATADYNRHINALLHAHGFINRVDIKKGVTASVAVFKYVGNDPDIIAVTKHGYIMVKLPPYTAAPDNFNLVANESLNENDADTHYVLVDLPRQTPSQIHAELTYNNEFKIISQMNPICLDETRPNVLAKELNRQKFIFNSPIFYDEKEFCRVHALILSGEYRRSFSFSDSDSSHEEGSFGGFEEDSEYRTQAAINGLLSQQFLNLSCRMRRLSSSNENHVKVINTLFYSIFHALNRLHKERIVHADLAGRNIVPRSDGTVALVDFGPSDTINEVNGNARLNIKYPQSSIMHNTAALKEDHLIGVITDYISLQKTFLQAIADYIEADFYKLITDNLPNAPHFVTIEFLLQYTDRQIIDNVVNNLTMAAEELIQERDIRGVNALNLIQQYKPYFDHNHNPYHTFAELQSAHSDSFYRCSPKAYVTKPQEKTKEKRYAYSNHVEERQSPQPAAPQRMTRSSTADKIVFFSRSRANSQSEPTIPVARASSKK